MEEKLTLLRRERGLSQLDLAERMDPSGGVPVGDRGRNPFGGESKGAQRPVWGLAGLSGEGGTRSSPPWKGSGRRHLSRNHRRRHGKSEQGHGAAGASHGIGSQLALLPTASAYYADVVASHGISRKGLVGFRTITANTNRGLNEMISQAEIYDQQQ